MSDDVQALIAELSLNTRRIEAQQRRLLKSFDDSFGKLEKSGKQRLTAIERQAEQMSRNVRRAIVGIAVGVAGREVLEYEAAWRNTTNTLKQYTDVLGPAQQSASALNQIANDARAPLQELSGVTGAAARSARDLGKSGASVLVFAEAAAKGARLANTGQAGVQGAFTQLSQAIASPRVQLQEFNSIIEGTPRLAQAFADGVDGAGGSVAKLRKLIADGDVSGSDLFEALVSQAETLKAEFSTLDQGPGEAVTRLRNKLIEFVGTNEVVKSGTKGLVTLIDLAADNLDILTEAIIVGTAALAGFYGTQGLLAVASGLQGVAVGATAGARAMALLRAASAFLLSPVGIAMMAAAAAGAIALVALNAGKAVDPLERLRKAQQGANEALQQTEVYVDRKVIARIGEEAGESVQPVSFLAGALREVAAAMQDATIAQFLQQMADLQSQISETQAAIDEGLAKRDRLNRQAVANSGLGTQALAAGGKAKVSIDTSELDSEIGLARATLAGLERRRTDIGVSLFGDGSSKEFTDAILKGDVATAAAVLKGRLQAVMSANQPSGKAGGGSDPEKDTLAKLDEIRNAYRQVYETEREAITRVRDERLAAIDAAGLKQAEADKLRQQANDVYLAQIEELEVAQLNADNAEYQRQADKVQAEKDALAEIQAARDETHGRMAHLLQSEYDQKKALIDKEIEDEARKAEAKAALDEDYAARKKELEDEVLGKGKFSSNEVERLNAVEAEKLAALEEWYALNLERKQEYEARKVEITEEAEAAITALRQEAAAAQLDAIEKGFNAASGLAKKFAGENSGIYKAMFLAEKAAALASAYVQMNLAVAKAAAAAPPPANAPLIATAKMTGLATIAGIAASAISGFKDGVVDYQGRGGPRSDSNVVRISRGESVMNEPATRRNEGLLRLMNDGVDVEARLARAAEPQTVAPAYFSGAARSVSIGGSTFVMNGPVNEDTLPAFRALIDQRDRDMAEMVESMIVRHGKHTTPRHLRSKFFGG